MIDILTIPGVLMIQRKDHKQADFRNSAESAPLGARDCFIGARLCETVKL